MCINSKFFLVLTTNIIQLNLNLTFQQLAEVLIVGQ